ncbi:MAG TPA: alpha/beta fold hydrolase [Thermohalobaculum sp.]|nr:alpha/beta fold hydrolase [Thermohalobaculum sp.]
MTTGVMHPAGAADRADPVGVALIHGLARSTGSMWLLARRLERAGFATVRIGYPSRRLDFEAAVRRVADEIRRRCAGWRLIHLVGHSLGGLIAARLSERPEGLQGLPLGRVVQLGAPGRGAAIARWLSRLGPARAFLGPALGDIAAREGRRHRPRPGVGAVAGRLPFGLRPPGDGLVSVRSAWDGAEARAAVRSIHGWLPLSPRTARLVVGYLRDGRLGEAER